MTRTPLILSLAITAAACNPEPEVIDTAGQETALASGIEALSLLGDTLRPPVQPENVREVYQARFEEAQDALVEAPEDADALIWMGRRTAYLGHYRDAIEIYSNAIARSKSRTVR